MTKVRSPFEPTFGKPPPVLVGRDDDITAFGEAVESGRGAELASLVTGSRGSGKTVLLNALEDEARRHGWVVYAEAGHKGLIDRLVEDHLRPHLLELEGDEPVELSSVTAAGFGASWERPERGSGHRRPSLRRLLSTVADRAASAGTGVVITVDELHSGERDELRELAATVQHMFREERPVAFVGAGLPAGVQALRQDRAITFLRRAHRIDVGPVSGTDVAVGLVEPLHSVGREITGRALAASVEATHGYPFMIQLVGDELFRAADGSVITDDVAAVAIPAAQRRLGRQVHEPALRDLSDIDRSFLVAMARDEGPSRLRDIAERLGVDGNYANVYRRRLIDADVIRPAGRGVVEFELPYLGEFLREHVTARLPDGTDPDEQPRLDP